ncbi:MAG: hypothetical protein Q8L69_10695 [Gallionellaceae bacterium]|nr:hypothetical protein [Gallionellaceae bacterium]
MTNANPVEHMYKTRMSAGQMSNPAGSEIKEQRHTRSEIISRAEEVLAKELGGDLASYAELEEKAKRGTVGDDTVWGYVNKTGKNVEFTEEMKLKAAIAVLNLNGHLFEATPVS